MSMERQLNKVVKFSYEWTVATPESALTMKMVRDAAHEINGSGTHWIETLEVPTKVE